MTPLLVVMTIAIFISADILIRIAAQRIREKRILSDRRKALDIGLRLEFARESVTLKRVVVERPRARILAVDDEKIVLDSFRKILVLAGYSIDTVETGKEAIGLVRNNDYDFVFTDLKMPEMDGLDVTKAVKHLRPDIDVIMITGFATIESAVDAMKYGALDYIQKPFTEDELIEFAAKSLYRREEKRAKEARPTVHLATLREGASESRRQFNVPPGVFLSPFHTWVSIEVSGEVRVGIDDFAQKIIGPFHAVMLPSLGCKVRRGDPLFTIARNAKTIAFPSPVQGNVTTINERLLQNPGAVNLKPYELGWFCCVDTDDLAEDLATMKIGAAAISWYQEEINRYVTSLARIRTQRPEDVRPGAVDVDGFVLWEDLVRAK